MKKLLLLCSVLSLTQSCGPGDAIAQLKIGGKKLNTAKLLDAGKDVAKAVTLSDSHLTALEGYTMDQGDLSIHGVLRTSHHLELTGCTVEIAAGELHCNNAMVNLDQNTTVDVAQDGYVMLSGNEGGYCTQLNGALTNRGTMESYTLIRLGGTLTNYGTFHFQQDIDASGTLDNQGTMLSYDGAGVSTESGGTFTGNQPKNG